MSADADPLVDRLAALLCDDCDPGPCHDSVSAAGRVLKFLANAGRLLPEGGQTRGEWLVRWDEDLEFEHLVGSREAATAFVDGMRRGGCRAAVESREVREFDDGSSFTGPWVAVDPEEKTDA